MKRVVPDARLRLIGLCSEKEFPQMGPDIDGLGFITDPTDEISTWSAMIVPIRFGSGTRVKIAEAFARRCPVVSTSIGAFGYQVVSGKDFLLADHPSEFAAACVELIRNPDAGRALAECARRKFLSSWTWDSIAPSVARAVEECAAMRGPTRP